MTAFIDPQTERLIAIADQLWYKLIQVFLLSIIDRNVNFEILKQMFDVNQIIGIIPKKHTLKRMFSIEDIYTITPKSFKIFNQCQNEQEAEEKIYSKFLELINNLLNIETPEYLKTIRGNEYLKTIRGNEYSVSVINNFAAAFNKFNNYNTSNQ